jgi:hypothetical protein
LFGDHSQQSQPKPSGPGQNNCAIIPNHRQTINRHWKILIVASQIAEKMAHNEAKYPADKVRGSSKKYTEYKTAKRLRE